MTKTKQQIPAPSFIQAFGDQLEARFENGHDTVSLILNRGKESGRIYSHRPFFMYRSWEAGPENKTDYQARALAEFTQGFARIEFDSDGDLYAVPFAVPQI